MRIRDKLARATYWAQGLADWEDKSKESLTEFYMTADQIIAIFKEFVETMELPSHYKSMGSEWFHEGIIEAQSQEDLLKAIKDKLEAKDG